MGSIVKTLFFFTFTQVTFSQWVTNHSFTPLNQNKVCYSGGSIYLLCEQGNLMISKDQGVNWSSIQLPTMGNLNDIFLFDENNHIVAGDSGRIFRTNNGWESYTEVSLPWYYTTKDIDFMNERGVAVGTKQVSIDGVKYFLPSIHITSDSGINWKEVSFNIYGAINSIVTLEDGRYIAVGDSGRIFYSNNYGADWHISSLPIVNNLYSISACSDFSISICGEKGTFFYSDDLGESWKALSIPDYYDLQNVCFNGSSCWMAAGSISCRIEGRSYLIAAILRFQPELNQWAEEFVSVSGKYNSISFCNPFQAIAVGSKGITAVYSSVTAVDKLPEQIGSYILFQNYPNPFNASTIININISEETNIQIIIFDAFGRKVRELVNEFKPAGTHQYPFVASGLVSGIYLYQIKAGAFSDIKKMQLLK